MNEQIVMWMIAQTIVLGGAVVGAYVSLIQRLTKVETTIELIGMKSATILHSPHTPELDILLEKYVDRNYELSPTEWRELMDRCADIENDPSLPKEERALAAIVGAVCSHKLRLDPPKANHHI